MCMWLRMRMRMRMRMYMCKWACISQGVVRVQGLLRLQHLVDILELGKGGLVRIGRVMWCLVPTGRRVLRRVRRGHGAADDFPRRRQELVWHGVSLQSAALLSRRAPRRTGSLGAQESRAVAFTAPRTRLQPVSQTDSCGHSPRTRPDGSRQVPGPSAPSGRRSFSSRRRDHPGRPATYECMHCISSVVTTSGPLRVLLMAGIDAAPAQTCVCALHSLTVLQLAPTSGRDYNHYRLPRT